MTDPDPQFLKKEKDRGPATAGKDIPQTGNHVLIGGIVVLVFMLPFYLVYQWREAHAAPAVVQAKEEFGTGVTHPPPPPVKPDVLLKPPPEVAGSRDAAQTALVNRAMELAERERESHAKLTEKRNKSPLFAFNTLAKAEHAAEQVEPVSENANQRFLEQSAQKQVKTVQAVQMDNLGTLIPQGTLISAVLETAIQSDLPGMLRAVVNSSVYSFDNKQMLIPKGTRLIGQYRSGVQRGQTRVFVIWDRLIRPDGVTVQLASPGTDDLGRAGLTGERDTHFLERFGSSILLSLIDGGITAGTNAVDNKDVATVAVNAGNGASRASDIALENSIAIPPTIAVNQGEPIRVFVAQDLDFSLVGKK